MDTKTEIKKKKEQEDLAQQKREEEERLERERFQKMNEDSTPEPTNLFGSDEDEDEDEDAQEKARFASKSDNKHWAEIVEAFTKQHGKDKVEPDGTLVFNSRDEAKDFFKQQAEGQPPKEFLVCEVDQNRKPSGYYVFSCGSGKMYEGANLADIKKQVEEDLEKSANDKNQPANDKLQQGLARLNTILKKEQLQQAKEEPKKDAPKPQDNLDVDDQEVHRKNPGL
ncbi:Uncharacterised protein [Legionella beliardensis]|uniref:Dot/Icm secretion system substrate n=1 Tax=Legionella beliardensis TaxID=91822 RepID=A0A378I0D4_9GAMM|nr:hypothetical protein [Legionella beliardensis]STX28211.1 Uncharacterised protein [Legionella beliardensis]